MLTMKCSTHVMICGCYVDVNDKRGLFWPVISDRTSCPAWAFGPCWMSEACEGTSQSESFALLCELGLSPLLIHVGLADCLRIV